jgi:uncharacterized protein YkwD
MLEQPVSKNSMPRLYAARILCAWLGLAGMVAASLPAWAQGEQPDLVRAERMAEALIEQQINAQRATLAPDAPPLVSNPTLDEIARARSNAMAHGAPFSHEDENGRVVAVDMMQTRFGSHGTWGENILEEGGYQVFDPSGFAERAVAGWMSSPGHRKNILSGNYRQSSVGVTVSGDRVFATQIFLGPSKLAPR